ncbi:hypothetical protein NDU88_004580 [Pleurodeles waltl]|uniref:Reverse transcriptase domain-containing protein n=1 Tax=Pleurodeles waltl TaxID=8319 RepID=A0AAV7SJB5_PLEWA|nr:hypothetical protein NDU88_004580 [Pleurodeles waltl]
MNADAKVFAKIIVDHLASLLSRLVVPQQHGFLPVRDTVCHVNTMVASFDVAETSSLRIGMVLLDAEKAFDHFVWDCPWDTMAAFGDRFYQNDPIQPAIFADCKVKITVYAHNAAMYSSNPAAVLGFINDEAERF